MQSRFSKMFNFDRLLSFFCLAGFAVIILAFRSDFEASDKSISDQPLLGVVMDSWRDVRRRSDSELVWNKLPKKRAIYNNDTVFVGDASFAKVRLMDGSELEIGENTLIVLSAAKSDNKQSDDKYFVGLHSGSVKGRLKQQSMDIISKDGKATLSPKSVATIRSDRNGLKRLEVSKGSAGVKIGEKSHSVTKNQVLNNAGKTAVVSAMKANLIEPAQNHRIVFTNQNPSITLVWKYNTAQSSNSKIAVEIALDAMFENKILTEPVTYNSTTFMVTQEGLHWWRLVSSSGRVISETRFFKVVRSHSPLVTSPLPESLIIVPDKKRLRLMWSAVAEAYLYRVQLSKDPEFSELIADASVQDTQFTFADKLEENFYYWRVRADEPWVPNAQYSLVAKFRLIHKPIHEAPTKLETEYTVDDK